MKQKSNETHAMTFDSFRTRTLIEFVRIDNCRDITDQPDLDKRKKQEWNRFNKLI